MALDQIMELGAPKKFNADDFIFHQGEPGNEMYILLSGRVDVYLNSFNGFPIKVSEVGPGGFFGEMSILEEQPRSATVIAAKDTMAIAINKSKFEIFITRQPAMAYKIMKALSSRVRSLNDEISKLREGNQEIVSSLSSKQEHPGSSVQVAASSTNPSSINEIVEIKGKLFPEGHRGYSLVASPAYNEFIFDKSIKCPICNTGFSVKMQRLSKLKMEKTENDFRQRYTDFEPIWYSIWACPNCFYTDFYHEFESVTDKQLKLLNETKADRKGCCILDTSEPRNINHVFTHYYLALKCAEAINAPSLKKARIWVRLQWLYKDVEDEDMFKMALEHTFENYYASFYGSKVSLPTEQEQQICLILGELFLLKGQENEALKHFYSAIKRSGGKEMLNNQAQDRIYEVKKKTGDKA